MLWDGTGACSGASSGVTWRTDLSFVVEIKADKADIAATVPLLRVADAKAVQHGPLKDNLLLKGSSSALGYSFSAVSPEQALTISLWAEGDPNTNCLELGQLKCNLLPAPAPAVCATRAPIAPSCEGVAAFDRIPFKGDLTPGEMAAT
jgi:hypothetical protein